MNKNLLRDVCHIDLEPYLTVNVRDFHRGICEDLATTTIRPEPVDFWYATTSEYKIKRAESDFDRKFKEFFYDSPPAPVNKISLVQQKDYRSMHLVNGTRQAAADQFPRIMALVNQLPFKIVGRVVLFEMVPGLSTPEHIDLPANENAVTQGNGHFVVLDPGAKSPVWYRTPDNQVVMADTSAVFFDTSLPHWCNLHSYRTYLIRVDGQFTDDFVIKIAENQT